MGRRNPKTPDGEWDLDGDAERIAEAWLNPGIFEVELEAGRAKPLPEHVSWWALAEQLGTKVYDAPSIEYMPIYLVHAASVMSKARSIVRTEREAESNQN